MDSEQFNTTPEVQTNAELRSGSADLPPKVEGMAEADAERFEKKADNSSTNSSTVSLPQVVVDSTIDNNSDVVAGSLTKAHVGAKHGERIEKEWVNMVKEVLKKTHDDPYEKEEGVKVIKADYLEKRYNRKLGHGE